MENPTGSEVLLSVMESRAEMSERTEAQLSRCPAQCETASGQRTGSSLYVPRLKAVTAAPAHLPGLNGRSVRQLHHLGAVRAVRRVLVSVVAAIAVVVGASVALPAYAQATAAPPPPPPQTLTIPTTAVIASVDRDGYTATAPPPVQWPTALHTKISDGYGPRVSPCAGCSTLHLGVDFDAGWGAEVHAMAAGVVVEVNSPLLASLGNHLIIQHMIDGQVVTSVYGHMQYGSTYLNVGDTVKVGQVIGLVGSTGASTGPHLHFEIRIDGSPVNPLDWLYAKIG